MIVLPLPGSAFVVEDHCPAEPQKSDRELKVWSALLRIPSGSLNSYMDIASEIGDPKASRAVGAAVGKNPVSFVVPCHRALGKGGALTGYHWGITRKQAMLGWEAGQVA